MADTPRRPNGPPARKGGRSDRTGPGRAGTGRPPREGQGARPSSDPARRAAVDLLDAVLGEGRLLAELTAEPRFERLDPPTRARAARLASETLRGLDRADRVLKPLLRHAPGPRIRNILRLGVVEIMAHAEAPHGVVSDLVSLAGASKRTAGQKGLVNAILRQVEHGAWGKLPVPRLPRWLRPPLVEAWGNPAVQRFETAHLRGAPLDLTVRDDPEGWAERLGGEVLPTGSVRLREAGQVSALPGFEAGAWWVQDAAAAMAVRLLDPRPGEAIADLCAAPGGKTLQLAAAGARVTAVDGNEARMARVVENLTRTGLQADLRIEDVLAHEGTYDAVLLDAPCSATGTIRRHPDLPHARDGAGISGLIVLQAKMIDAGLAMVRPGGRLVFCTCSLIPDEGEVQIDEALARHPALVVERPEMPGIEADWITQEGGLRLRPDHWADRGGMDGFYMARLRVPG
ncbi:MAG: RsmB/NOP family class I SAM-dependent RNA methyltransferase [Shimia sp.]